jgi:hypothetical protein
MSSNMLRLHGTMVFIWRLLKRFNLNQSNILIETYMPDCSMLYWILQSRGRLSMRQYTEYCGMKIKCTRLNVHKVQVECMWTVLRRMSRMMCWIMMRGAWMRRFWHVALDRASPAGAYVLQHICVASRTNVTKWKGGLFHYERDDNITPLGSDTCFIDWSHRVAYVPHIDRHIVPVPVP